LEIAASDDIMRAGNQYQSNPPSITGTTIMKRLVALTFVIVAACGGIGQSLAVSPAPNPVTTVPNTPQTAAGFPMPIEAFLAGNYLERADVVLTRRDWDFTSYVIRKATSSPFSHAALVFNRIGQEAGIDNTFVIEAGTTGVDLTNLRDYVNDKSSFIAIKRLKQGWFGEDKQARVRGLLLDKIKASYNYWAIGRIARSIWFGVQNTIHTKTEEETSRERTLQSYRENEWTPPSEFICSGLVQIGFVETVIEYIKRGQLPASALNEVVFHRGAEKWLPDADGWRQLGSDAGQSAEYFEEQNISALESVTPEDLARSDKLEWLYLIRGGEVHKVASYDEVTELLK
jgi:hypothetical protein